jgi:23S rRNA (cytosine1962-C5)-methyltransferase
MFSTDQYQLLDFGDGRRLERFGQYVLDRPCPAADGIQKSSPELWSQAQAHYVKRELADGSWRSANEIPLSWPIYHGQAQLELKLTDFGHIGVFPEHAGNWDWIARQLKAAGEPMRVLNLFAYTGGATLACAASGAEVVHVDSAQNSVLWARRNTERSGLGDASIRWITEDALKFVGRELKRGNKYHGVVLDPPSYGHGPKGEVWKIQTDLPELLEMCAELTEQDRRFILMSCHTTGYVPADLQKTLRDGFPVDGPIQAGGLAIRAADGRNLPCGVAARWSIYEKGQ